ncbi:cell division cycle-associated protein 7 [Pyrus x bretschneideri]|uniref:cell division cycle-associated protein 7 n=1 Tax=Pyrus x bretschneideri TaxID=225117 RepID=UPI00202FC8B1|nr:cell division cycle-associated protein 7 [Pyrus x bretschneideri]
MVVRRNRRGGDSEEGGGATVENGSAGVSGYEHFRDQKIRENKERLQKLGILDLAKKLKTEAAAPKRPYRPKTHNPLPNPGSPRRSSRLKSVAPVDYVEKKKNESSKRKSVEIFIKEGSKPEIYTEEHEKLLGDCVESWELGVDGYGEDRKRIYDPVNGETCHQCRQKTLGHHTKCWKCDLVQGQFCGDCLYMRYGENVIEANENPGWTCPVCRGICNCSLCRQAKGWEPTGNLYRKVIKLGCKSVAHYLIQTRRSPTNSETTGEEVVAEGSTPSVEPSSHDESSGTGNDLDTSKHVDDNDVGNVDAVAAGDAVDGEAKKKLRRNTRLSKD